MFGPSFGKLARMGAADAFRVGLTVAAVLAATLGAAGLLAADPAPAQTSYDAPDYVLEEDGTVVIDGDGATDCRSFAAFLEQGSFESGDTLSAGARRVLDQCEEAGMPTSRPPAEVRQEIRQDVRRGALPETGGVPLPPLFVGALLVASAAGLLAFRKVG